MRLRFVLIFFALAAVTLADSPTELIAALKSFRAEPPPGWSFTQTTTGGGESLVERCDAAKPEFNRWSLLEKNGRAPTEDEIRSYTEVRARRSRSGTAPKVTDQIDLASIKLARDSAERATYHARLVPGESRDHTAAFLRVTLLFHKATRAIESLELANTEPFSPTIGVRIAAMKTTMRYTLPTADTPALPLEVATHVRGRAFWLKSLDADLRVEFSNYVRTAKAK